MKQSFTEEEMRELLSGIENVRLNEEETAVVVLDQTALPGKKVFLELGDAKALYDAIFELKVRGAPAIASQAVLIPTASAPSICAIFTSAGVSKLGPLNCI